MTQSNDEREENGFETEITFEEYFDEKQREIATAIGLVVMKWNTIHNNLLDLFVEVTQLNPNMASAIWNSVWSDSAQRNLLRGAVEKAFVKPNQLGVKENIMEFLKKIKNESQLRNRFIHCPYAPIIDEDDIKYIPDAFSGNRHAEYLKDVDLLAELPKFSEKLDDLIRYTSELIYCVRNADQNPKWPFGDQN